MNAIEIRGLTKSYGGFRLDGLDLTLPMGCIMGLVGENGAGKSTTVRLMLGMAKPDAGTVRLMGRGGRELTRDEIGVVLDEVGITGCLTAEELGRVLRGIYKTWDGAAYAGYIDRLAIPRGKQFKDMSRGNKMKLGIAAALSHGAKLLILDEATSGLDPVVRDEVIDILCDFTRDEEHSVLMNSHIVSDLEKACDYIAFLHEGRLLLCEEKDRLCEEYGIMRCTAEELSALAPGSVIGQRSSPYGVEAIVRRAAVPDGTALGRVSIEELFIFMVKGER